MNSIRKKSKSSNNIINFLVGLLITLGLIGIDQWTKGLAVSGLMNKPNIIIFEGVFELMYLENKGAAFGIFQNQKLFFLIGAVVVSVIAVYVYCKVPNTKKYYWAKIICILMTAGAIGNMIDRILNNYVVDFFYFSLINFPVFNVADIYVTVGAFLMFAAILFVYKDGDFSFLFSDKKEK